MQSAVAKLIQERLFIGSSIRATVLFMVTLLLALPVYAQKLEVRNKSRIRLGSTQISETAKLSDKRYSLGFTNTFREGRKLNNVFSGRFNPTKSTKLYLNTEYKGGAMTWEAKFNKK